MTTAHDSAALPRSSAAAEGRSRTRFDWHGAVLAVALAVAGWALAEVHAHAERLARVEQAAESLTRTLERIELKIDRLQENR